MSMPRSTKEVTEAFRALVPPRELVTLKPMFGNLAAFVNGNMFAGVFGDDLFVRVRDKDRTALVAEGGRDFEPMPGKPMTGYVVLPSTWRAETEMAERWVTRALASTSTMPATKPKSKDD
jgi:TfoX/Sxy family transcriptional regulator of competence genes